LKYSRKVLVTVEHQNSRFVIAPAQIIEELGNRREEIQNLHSAIKTFRSGLARCGAFEVAIQLREKMLSQNPLPPSPEEQSSYAPSRAPWIE
jgi:hypothetical protein